MNRFFKRIYGALYRHFRWWDDRASENWRDFKTLPGLFSGLLSMMLNLIQFTLLLFLGVLLGAAHSGGDPVTSLNVLVLLLSLLFGAGMFYLHQTNDRIHQQMQTFPETMVLGLKTQLLVYGSYSVLLLYDPVVAIAAAIAYLFGKSCMLLAYFIPAQLKRMINRI